MASTTFVDNSSIIYASWLNDINATTYSGTFISSTITPSNLVCNGSVSGTGFTGLVNNTLSAPGQIGNGTPNTGAFTTLSTSGLATLNSLTVSGASNLGTPSTLVGTNITGTANSLNAGLGVNQTWQNVTGTRSLNADQTNGTSKPIQVVVSLSTQNPSGGGSASTATALIAGVIVAFSNSSDSSGFYSTPVVFSFIVPAGAVYRVNTTTAGGSTTTLSQWAELR